MNTNQTLTDLLHEAQLMVRLLEEGAASGNADAITLAVLRKKCVYIYEQLLQVSPEVATHPKTVQPYEHTGNPPLIIDEPTPESMRPLVEEQVNAHQTEEETAEPLISPVADEQPEPTPVLQPVTTLFTQNEIENTIERKHAEEEQKKTAPFTPEETGELSLHEKLSLSTESRLGLADKMQQRVESLKSAISLNKKIAFVNQLFSENTVEYAKAIEKLNQANNLDEALRYYSELKIHYQWDTQHELVKDLEQLIVKRFS
ncbi:MAG: hypothetical protein ACK4Y6_08440 [Bacteroidota bacterium]|jgi:hypothetical protein